MLLAFRRGMARCNASRSQSEPARRLLAGLAGQASRRVTTAGFTARVGAGFCHCAGTETQPRAMKSESKKPELQSEVLIMPDGKIYAHNLTPEMARVLSELNPADENIQQRVITHVD